MRKSLIFVLVIMTALFGRGTAFAQSGTAEKTEDILYINDGYIELGGTMKYADENCYAVLTVFEGGKTSGFEMPSDGKIVYAAEQSVTAKGEWSFDFALENSGRYTAYIGSDVVNENEVTEFYFINKDKFDSATEELSKADSDDAVAGILETSSADLGVPFKDMTDLDSTAKLLKNELGGKKISEPKEMQKLLKTCCMIAGLNSGGLTSLEEYKDVLCKDGVLCANYLTDTVLDDICPTLSKKGLDGTQKFYAESENAIIVSVINNGTEDSIKSVLGDYKSKLGVRNGNISDKLVSALREKDFSNIDEVKSFISNYDDGDGGDSGGSKGSGGSGGSGSSFGTKNTYTGKEAEVKKDDGSEAEKIYPFDDIADIAWAADAITQLSYRGVLNGKSDRIFMPNDNVTREEFAKITAIGFGLNLINTECPFGDVDKEDWAYPYIRSAYKAGIVKGVSDTEFGYGMNITREDLCVMIDRMIEIGELTLSQSDESVTFADEGDVSEYARESVYRLAKADIVSGDGVSFNPKAYATRAEAAKIVYLALVKTNR